MRKPTLRHAILIGLISAPALIAVSYLGNALAGLSFLPYDLFDWIARALPGPLVTLGIDTLVAMLSALGLSVSETAKLAEQVMALLIVIALGPILGVLVGVTMNRTQLPTAKAGIVAGLPSFLFFLVVELTLGLTGNFILALAWLFLLTAGWGVVIALALKWLGREMRRETQAEGRPEYDAGRRAAILKLTGAAAGLTVGAWGLGRLAAVDTGGAIQESGAGRPLPTSPPTTPGAPQAAVPQIVEIPPTPSGRISTPPGIRPEVTSNEDFYRIDINMIPPVINGDGWQLEVAGLFQNARNLTLRDLMAFPAVTQPLTLSCISNRVGGDLIGTSYWTGVRLRDVLEELQLAPEAGALFIEAEDGFYETVAAEDMFDERTLLVYGMNGETLPVEHGFPLRIYIPNRYGMKQPKWIVRMEAVEAWRPGYWVERGWSREARPQIVSVIDVVATEANKDGVVPLGGIAWAGDRGIERVEIRVDAGPWQEAQLRTPPLSGLTWVQWRFDWAPEAGRHTFAVRATDGEGAVQTDEMNDPHPDGATGFHTRTVTI